MEIPPPVPKSLLTVVNQVYELEQKLKKLGLPEGIQRNVNKMKDAFEEYGLVYDDPMGQRCSETRTDLEMTIAGPETDNLVVMEVIRPIVRQRNPAFHGDPGRIVQRGIVVVDSLSKGQQL
jgi:hypothetical protein